MWTALREFTGLSVGEVIADATRAAIAEAHVALAAQTRRAHQELVRHTVAQALGLVATSAPTTHRTCAPEEDA